MAHIASVHRNDLLSGTDSVRFANRSQTWNIHIKRMHFVVFGNQFALRIDEHSAVIGTIGLSALFIDTATVEPNTVLLRLLGEYLEGLSSRNLLCRRCAL